MNYRDLKELRDSVKKQIYRLRTDTLTNSVPNSKKGEYIKAIKRKEFEYKLLNKMMSSN
jgi:hypothetical protein